MLWEVSCFKVLIVTMLASHLAQHLFEVAHSLPEIKGVARCVVLPKGILSKRSLILVCRFLVLIIFIKQSLRRPLSVQHFNFTDFLLLFFRTFVLQCGHCDWLDQS